MKEIKFEETLKVLEEVKERFCETYSHCDLAAAWMYEEYGLEAYIMLHELICDMMQNRSVQNRSGNIALIRSILDNLEVYKDRRNRRERLNGYIVLREEDDINDECATRVLAYKAGAEKPYVVWIRHSSKPVEEIEERYMYFDNAIEAAKFFRYNIRWGTKYSPELPHLGCRFVDEVLATITSRKEAEAFFEQAKMLGCCGECTLEDGCRLYKSLQALPEDEMLPEASELLRTGFLGGMLNISA